MADFAQAVDALAQFGGDAPYDLMLEAKMKDVALLKLLEETAQEGWKFSRRMAG
jgi:hypothetical protein